MECSSLGTERWIVTKFGISRFFCPQRREVKQANLITVQQDATYTVNYISVKWRNQDFFLGGGVQQIQLRTEDRENGDLRAVAS